MTYKEREVMSLFVGKQGLRCQSKATNWSVFKSNPYCTAGSWGGGGTTSGEGDDFNLRRGKKGFQNKLIRSRSGYISTVEEEYYACPNRGYHGKCGKKGRISIKKKRE